MATGKKVIGIGAALVDLLIEESDSYIKELGVSKGGMTLVDWEYIQKALSKARFKPSVVPGGSACNTMVGLACLGGQAVMIGCRGQDEMGNLFQSGLDKTGVDAKLKTSVGQTGMVLSVVTPDAQRTMFTFLGASAEFGPEDLSQGWMEGAHIIHLEGYLLFNRPLVERILAYAEKNNLRVCLDLASFQVVEATKDWLESLIPKHVDILIANEDEARAFTGKSEEESLHEFSKITDIAVVKMGERGAWIATNAEKIRIEAKTVKAVDTTGAGDLWAAGFLYGLAHDFSLKDSGDLGSIVASEVVQVLGAVIPDTKWEGLRTKAENLLVQPSE